MDSKPTISTAKSILEEGTATAGCMDSPATQALAWSVVGKYIFSGWNERRSLESTELQSPKATSNQTPNHQHLFCFTCELLSCCLDSEAPSQLRFGTYFITSKQTSITHDQHWQQNINSHCKHHWFITTCCATLFVRFLYSKLCNFTAAQC